MLACQTSENIIFLTLQLAYFLCKFLLNLQPFKDMVTVNLGCYNELLQMSGLSNKHLFLTVLEVGSLRFRHQQIGYLWEDTLVFFFGLQIWPLCSFHPHEGSGEQGRERKRIDLHLRALIHSYTNPLGASLVAQRETRFDPWVGKIPWRRKQHPTAVFLPRKSYGWRSLVGYSPQGRKE